MPLHLWAPLVLRPSSTNPNRFQFGPSSAAIMFLFELLWGLSLWPYSRSSLKWSFSSLPRPKSTGCSPATAPRSAAKEQVGLFSTAKDWERNSRLVGVILVLFWQTSFMRNLLSRRKKDGILNLRTLGLDGNCYQGDPQGVFGAVSGWGRWLRQGYHSFEGTRSQRSRSFQISSSLSYLGMVAKECRVHR